MPKIRVFVDTDGVPDTLGPELGFVRDADGMPLPIRAFVLDPGVDIEVVKSAPPLASAFAQTEAAAPHTCTSCHVPLSRPLVRYLRGEPAGSDAAACHWTVRVCPKCHAREAVGWRLRASETPKPVGSPDPTPMLVRVTSA